MTEILIPCLRVAGAGLLLLAVVHVPIAGRLRWKEDAAKMSPINEAVFHVHSFFICVVLVVMGLACLFDPRVFLETSRASAWAATATTVFWTLRLCCQWTVYQPSWWREKPFERRVHWFFTFVWAFLVAVFGGCAAWHAGWID